MGMRGSPTAQLQLRRRAGRRPTGSSASEGQGFTIALAALDAGRLGIAACAVGVAQAALDAAVAYAGAARQFGRADRRLPGRAASCSPTWPPGSRRRRALYLAAARRRDAGLPYARQAAMAKLFCTDMAMRVTTDAVQVLGGYGYTADFPVERYMREAKVLQIVEGTNQVQRLVISRALTRP